MFLDNKYSLNTFHFHIDNIICASDKAVGMMHLAAQTQEECAAAIGNELSRGLTVIY